MNDTPARDEAATDLPAGLELAANIGGNRAHYSDNLKPSRYYFGRHGSALCSNASNVVLVRDQDATIDSMPRGWRKPRWIPDMPLCAKCVRAASKRGDSR